MEWHVTIAGDERRSLCSSEAARTRAAAAVARAGGAGLLLFCVADDHVHLVLRGERRRAGQLAGNVAQALRRVVEVPLEPARVRPVRSRAHLEHLVPYVLDQTTHHRLANAEHPACWTGSCFLDLVGARSLPGFDRTILAEALPRWREADVFRAVGSPVVGAATDDVLATMGLHAWCRAASSAQGLVDLAGVDRRSVRAKAVVATLARRFHVPATPVAAALGLSDRRLRELTGRPGLEPDERVVRRLVALWDAATSSRTRDAASR